MLAVGSSWNNYQTVTASAGFTTRFDTSIAGGNQIQFILDQVADAGSFGGATAIGTLSSEDAVFGALLEFH